MQAQASELCAFSHARRKIPWEACERRVELELERCNMGRFHMKKCNQSVMLHSEDRSTSAWSSLPPGASPTAPMSLSCDILLHIHVEESAAGHLLSSLFGNLVCC
jgi:hypothetical protein